MLAKKFRLTHQEFLAAKKIGKTVRNTDLSVVVAPNKLKFSRFAVVTSTKLHKSAVVRNTLRRQLYDCLGKMDLENQDILIFPRSSMLNLSNEDLGARLNSLLPKTSRLA